MANAENIIKANAKRTTSEARERGRKGGIASGKARREKKSMQEWAQAILNMPMRQGDLDDVDTFEGLVETVKGKKRPKNVTVEQAAMMAVAKRAMAGDTKALSFLRDTAGEKPVEKVEVSQSVNDAAKDIQRLIEAKKAKANGG